MSLLGMGIRYINIKLNPVKDEFLKREKKSIKKSGVTR
jgi:hypothetical protein